MIYWQSSKIATSTSAFKVHFLFAILIWIWNINKIIKRHYQMHLTMTMYTKQHTLNNSSINLNTFFYVVDSFFLWMGIFYTHYYVFIIGFCTEFKMEICKQTKKSRAFVLFVVVVPHLILEKICNFHPENIGKIIK